MALGNLAISHSNFWQGQVVERFDCATVLYLDAVIMPILLSIIPFLRNREPDPEPVLA